MPPTRASAAPCATASASWTSRRWARSTSRAPTPPSSSTASTRIAVDNLAVGECRYGLMCHADGMVLDDGVAMRLAENRFLMTTTTGNAARVLDWLEEWLQTEWPELDVRLTSVTDHWAAVAVAGPRSRAVLAALAPDVAVDADGACRSWRRARRGRGRPGAAVPHQLLRRAGVRDQRAGALRARGVGGGDGGRRRPRDHAVRHGGDARAARREGLRDRRPGHRRHGDAAGRRPRLGSSARRRTSSSAAARTAARQRRADRRQLVGLLPEDPRLRLPEGAPLLGRTGAAPATSPRPTRAPRSGARSPWGCWRAARAARGDGARLHGRPARSRATVTETAFYDREGSVVTAIQRSAIEDLHEAMERRRPHRRRARDPRAAVRDPRVRADGAGVGARRRGAPGHRGAGGPGTFTADDPAVVPLGPDEWLVIGAGGTDVETNCARSSPAAATP